ncbi:DUF4974 domain-containing protein [Acinetobacter qingfengensis]|uniref:Uncharacterized protein n=1 Tax=Acinetobacter qingfengensis TaxID=1262585 RepID=A0A1E7R345_9GAMM|nr:FecR domain-containing protein [Acinetobacter qingfengensis]KAA8733768.1 DUF4974 domain-containing protein [Acinetobacter qingfengensis]OEY93721.1 hypothetical protein BJI46_04570 [Acinetobacter qingfengensis]
MTQQSDQQVRQQAYEQAAHWYMQLKEQGFSEEQQQAFDQWLNANSLHQHIWQNVTMFDEKFNRLSRPVLAKTMAHIQHKKKVSGGKWCLGLLAVMTAFYAYQSIRQQDYLPDLLSFDAVDVYTTRMGETQYLTLQDGSQIWINSASKIRVKYTDFQRQIELAQGEIFIETHHDVQKRQFYVSTSHGKLQALGTVFNVHYLPDQTELSVKEGIVRIQTVHGQYHQDITAEHAAVFDQNQIHQDNYQATQFLWREHLLVVHSMPLKQVVAELSRYYPGEIELDPSLEQVLISGSYSTQNIEKTLKILATTYQFNMRVISEQKLRVQQ